MTHSLDDPFESKIHIVQRRHAACIVHPCASMEDHKSIHIQRHMTNKLRRGGCKQLHHRNPSASSRSTTYPLRLLRASVYRSSAFCSKLFAPALFHFDFTIGAHLPKCKFIVTYSIPFRFIYRPRAVAVYSLTFATVHISNLHCCFFLLSH
ncbi:hypothetical protein Tcan_01655, partial [Toxocara canis]